MSMITDEQLLDVLRGIPPLIPQFLRKRRVGLSTPSEVAADLGIERPLVFTILQIDFISGMYSQQGATLAQLRSYDAYAAKDNLHTEIETLKARGLVEESADGMLCLTPKGLEADMKVQLAGIEFVGKRKTLPDAVLTRLAGDLEHAAAIQRNKLYLLDMPGSHLKAYVAGMRYRTGDLVPLVRIEQALLELWGARDDSHVTAWRDAGLEGPPFDVLSHIWSGITTLPALTEALKYKQSPDDVESSLSWLAARDLVERHADDLAITPKGVIIREDIERETDRMFFEGWQLSIQEATWMRDNLADLVQTL